MVRQILYGTPEYDAELRLRDEVLRKPLGLTFPADFLIADKTDIHFAAFDGDDMSGCLLLSPITEKKLKMRQVAVSPQNQGQGIGKKLVDASETYARENGYAEIELSARETAVKFYLSLGYEVVGEPYEEVGLLHRRMRKSVR